MDKEMFRLHDTPQSIINSRPKKLEEEEKYWVNYEDLVDQIIFGRQINPAFFQGKSLEIKLRQDMEPTNIGDEIKKGREEGLGMTENELDCMKYQLEKVIEFVPLEKTEIQSQQG